MDGRPMTVAEWEAPSTDGVTYTSENTKQRNTLNISRCRQTVIWDDGQSTD
jgi:hypothetical protein